MAWRVGQEQQQCVLVATQGSNSRLQGNWYCNTYSLGQLFMSKAKTGIPMLWHYYFCKFLHKQKCTKSIVLLEFLNAKVTVFVPIISTHKNIFSPELWKKLSLERIQGNNHRNINTMFHQKVWTKQDASLAKYDQTNKKNIKPSMFYTSSSQHCKTNF